MPAGKVGALGPAPSKLAITIDLEEYFQVEAMAGAVARDAWSGLPSRIEASTERLLELYAAADAHATFFVVGWVAERFPRMMARIAAAGHELGCHSYWHRPVFGLSRDEFREDTRRAKAAIEDAAGVEVQGYRAPNFSIRAGMEWAWEELAEAGFRYDSSVHPIRHPF
ncbi:MAG: polysaccharide deacetylase family protein, partial [Terriglobales bacterium]